MLTAAKIVTFCARIAQERSIDDIDIGLYHTLQLVSFGIILILFQRRQKAALTKTISYLKTRRAFDDQIHSRVLLAAVVCWLATL